MKGWHKNFLAKKKEKKQTVLNTLHSLEKNKEDKDLIGVEAQLWLDTKELLDDIYLEEENY
jgi:uncharacterized protein YacL (UPF0231 family)